MKKNYVFILFTVFSLASFAQVEGTWRLAPINGALKVGPALGDWSWWSSSMTDVSTRSCLFDDSITFATGGVMTHYMDGSTWVEDWQGVTPAGCGTPVAPHDGTTNAPFSYLYNSGNSELTVNGVGAHLGLAKVYNAGELTSSAGAPNSITYLVSFSPNTDTMSLDINFGPGWWRYTYVKSSIWNIPNPNVTFKVNMSNYTGTIGNGVFVNGSFNGWCGSCNPMTDMGNGIWQVTLPLSTGPIEYKFTVDGWNDQEIFTGTESCIDPTPDNYNNRYYQVSVDATLATVCFGSCDPCLTVSPELVGTWKLKEEAGSLAVGPSQGSAQWWFNNLTDVTTRSCLFDDSLKFNADGSFIHYMDGNTWLEAWQGANPDGCGVPVAPHDGTTNAPYTYSYNSATGELTTIGIGAHLGLSKVTNGGELTSPANTPNSITYLITLSNNNNTMTADINFGIGWWRFVYDRTVPLVVQNPNITFKVDMTPYTNPITQGVFLNGDFNGWCGTCTPLTNISGNIWETTISLPIGPVQYKFTIDGWNDQEFFVGTESCIDPVADGFYNRYYQVATDATLPAVCFASCDVCPGSGLDENSYNLTIYPNPSRDIVSIQSDLNITELSISSMNGKDIMVKTLNSNSGLLNISNLPSGMYLININTVKGKIVKTMIKE
jgi:hypothetical protein